MKYLTNYSLFESVNNTILYHGSQKLFDNFKQETIDRTMRGYGFYFTANKEVAEGYADENSSYLIIDGEEYTNEFIKNNNISYEEDQDLIGLVQDILKLYSEDIERRQHGNPKDTHIETLKKIYLPQGKELLRLLKNAKKVEPAKKRYLYTAKITGEWFTSSANGISLDSLEKLSNEAEKIGGLEMEDDWEIDKYGLGKKSSSYGVDVEEIYKWLIKSLGSDKKASDFLYNAGFVGIKFSNNEIYLVFKADDINIMKVDKF